MADLKTNYKDDVLDTSVNDKRKYRMIQNPDGTVSFDDVTAYTQNGDTYGSNDVNETNGAVNGLNISINAEVERAKGAESTLTNNLNSEISRAKGAESTLNNNINNANTNIANLSNTKSDKWYSGVVSGSFVIPDGTSEVIITVAVGGNPAILLQAHWMHLMIDWWGTQLKAFRMLGKSAINGVEYGAVIAYDTENRTLGLTSAWTGTTDVTSSSTITLAYR